MEKKDELLRTHPSSFAALTAFLESSATLIQRHMPDKIIEGTSKRPLTKHEQKQADDLKAKLAKIKARTNEKPPEKSDDKSPYTKEILEEKMGKCPLCNTYHYYVSKRGVTKGQNLASAFLSGCSKYTAA